MRAKNWTGVASVPRWYCVAVGLFLGIRAISTLTAGASFALPGDGWRALFQLVAVAILAAGIVAPGAARTAAAAVGVIYLLATLSELVDGTTLLGAIPVDMRDRLVHPLIALLAAVALVTGRIARPMQVRSTTIRLRHDRWHRPVLAALPHQWPHLTRERTSFVARPTAMDEYFVHQIPELLPNVAVHHRHWRESYFYELHAPSGDGDAVFFTMAHYPAQERVDSLQMGRVAGRPILGVKGRPYDGDPHTAMVPGARVDVVTPMREVRLWAEPSDGGIGLDLTWRARTQPYGLRRGTMRAGGELVWDQSHIFQSGTYAGTYTVDGTDYAVDDWTGQRDHSWGVRDHGRCPLWLWWQIQLDDGFLGVWHWELPNGAIVYRDGCWAGADMSEPVPVVDFRYDARWVGADRQPAPYGEHGDGVAGLVASATFTLADRRVIEVDAQGTMARPYEPFYRGGLNLMRVSTGDGRQGTAIYEVTGARHHRFFPHAVVEGTLPA